MKYERIRELPLLVRTLSFTFDGYIVGTGAKYLAGITDIPPSDWDVVIPPEKFSEACKIVPWKTETNTFGGFKIDNVDFWSEDLGHYFRTLTKNVEAHVAIHVRSQTIIKRIN